MAGHERLVITYIIASLKCSAHVLLDQFFRLQYRRADDDLYIILMKIPMDRDLAVAYSRGIPLVVAKPEWRVKFVELLELIELFGDIDRMVRE